MITVLFSLTFAEGWQVLDGSKSSYFGGSTPPLAISSNNATQNKLPIRKEETL